MDEVRRDEDGELCGFVVRDEAGNWAALTVFGGTMARFPRRAAAEEHVLAEGLSSLADRWLLTNGTTGEADEVRIQQASPDEVVVAVGFYSVPGVATRRIGGAELAAGDWTLERITTADGDWTAFTR